MSSTCQFWRRHNSSPNTAFSRQTMLMERSRGGYHICTTDDSIYIYKLILDGRGCSVQLGSPVPLPLSLLAAHLPELRQAAMPLSLASHQEARPEEARESFPHGQAKEPAQKHYLPNWQSIATAHSKSVVLLLPCLLTSRDQMPFDMSCVALLSLLMHVNLSAVLNPSFSPPSSVKMDSNFVVRIEYANSLQVLWH